jgi:sn-glycerol 3-phosphate transport system substrate-binding protein
VKRRAALPAGLLLLMVSCLAWAAPARQDIRLWHGLSGFQQVHLEVLAARFNASQRAYRVVPVFKGADDLALASALAARPKGRGPHIVLINDVSTADVLERKAVRPLWEVLEESGQRLDAKVVPAVAGSFSDTSGRLLALPFNTSTPVLYYNRDAFRQARLDPSQAPKSWYDMPAALGALADAGSTCPFTTAFPAWILLENMSAWHNQAFATHENGMDGGEAELAFNGRLMVRWIAMMASWQKAGYFSYSGRGREAEERFARGECAVLTSSSASYAELRGKAGFDLGVAHFPYYDDFAEAPQNTLIGGGALFIMAGRSKAENRGAARFIAWLTRPEVQAEWHQKTGSMPLTAAAYELTRKQGFYEQQPAHDIAVGQLVQRAPARYSRGIRIVQLRAIRGIVDEELEAVWLDRKTPLEALNAAVTRGNAFLGQMRAGH